METLGQKLKDLREEAGLTQVELAKLLFIDKSTIAKYETDKDVPSFAMVIKIAKFFKVRTDYFAGLED